MVGLESKLALNLEEVSSTLSATLKGFAFSLFWLLREDAMTGTATVICFSLRQNIILFARLLIFFYFYSGLFVSLLGIGSGANGCPSLRGEGPSVSFG
jgi:hypothetical protein